MDDHEDNFAIVFAAMGVGLWREVADDPKLVVTVWFSVLFIGKSLKNWFQAWCQVSQGWYAIVKENVGHESLYKVKNAFVLLPRLTWKPQGSSSRILRRMAPWKMFACSWTWPMIPREYKPATSCRFVLQLEDFAARNAPKQNRNEFTVFPWISALGAYFFFGGQGGRLLEGGRLFEGGGGGGALNINVCFELQVRIFYCFERKRKFVKNGSKVNSKAFILLYVMHLRCFARSQIPHRRHRVTGQISGGLVSGLVQY